MSVPTNQATPPPSNTERSQTFRFLDLPTELRLNIYEHLLVVGKIFYTPDWLDKREGSRFNDVDDYATPSLTILRANKQIHAEAEPIYLAKNLFVLPRYWNLMPPFAESTSVANERTLFSYKAYEYVQNLSIEFSSLPSDIPLTHLSSDWNGEAGNTLDFDSMTTVERMDLVHKEAWERLYTHWDHMANALDANISSQLVYLEVDFTNAYCPVGCCRMVDTACDSISDTILRPEVMALLGLRNEGEEQATTQMIRSERAGGVKQEAREAFKLIIRGEGEPWAAWKTCAQITEPDTVDEDDEEEEDDDDEDEGSEITDEEEDEEEDDEGSDSMLDEDDDDEGEEYQNMSAETYGDLYPEDTDDSDYVDGL